MKFDFSLNHMMAIRHLRFQRLWISVGVMLLMAVAFASIIALPPPLKVLVVQDKVAHTLAYASLMGWFSQIYRHDLTRLSLAVALVLMGVLIEFVQGMTPTRQFDLLDMVANTSGVALAWALAYTWVGGILVWLESLITRSSRALGFRGANQSSVSPLAEPSTDGFDASIGDTGGNG